MNVSTGDSATFSDELIVRGFFETANRDRVTFEILYKFKIYSLATFHLQQYIEKIAKIFSIEFEGVSPSNIRYHDFFQWMNIDAKKKGRVEKYEDLFAWTKKIDVITRCTQDDINKQIAHFQDHVKKFFKKTQLSLTKEQLETTSRYYATMTTILLYITPHEQYSRYPAIFLDELDYNFYNEGSSIVSSLPLLFGYAMHIENLLIYKTKYLSEKEKDDMMVDVDLSRLVDERDLKKMTPFQRKQLFKE